MISYHTISYTLPYHLISDHPTHTTPYYTILHHTIPYISLTPGHQCNGATRCCRCTRANDLCIYPPRAHTRDSPDEPPTKKRHLSDCEALLRASDGLPPLLPRQAPSTAPSQAEPSFQVAGLVLPPQPQPLHTRGDSPVSASSTESVAPSTVPSATGCDEHELQEVAVSRMLLIEPSRPGERDLLQVCTMPTTGLSC